MGLEGVFGWRVVVVVGGFVWRVEEVWVALGGFGWRVGGGWMGHKERVSLGVAQNSSPGETGTVCWRGCGEVGVWEPGFGNSFRR